jgi:hypothetical protein
MPLNDNLLARSDYILQYLPKIAPRLKRANCLFHLHHFESV